MKQIMKKNGTSILYVKESLSNQVMTKVWMKGFAYPGPRSMCQPSVNCVKPWDVIGLHKCLISGK